MGEIVIMRSTTAGVYLCCVVEAAPSIDGCPVCGCHESYRARDYVHLRFIGATIYCEFVGHRLRLPADPPYGEAFVCPGCSQHVAALNDQRPAEKTRR